MVGSKYSRHDCNLVRDPSIELSELLDYLLSLKGTDVLIDECQLFVSLDRIVADLEMCHSRTALAAFLATLLGIRKRRSYDVSEKSVRAIERVSIIRRQEYLGEMLDKGNVRLSASPYATLVLIVKKPDERRNALAIASKPGH